MNLHEGVECDFCHRRNFPGRRFKCLICPDYDLCGECYDIGVTSLSHNVRHPIQCIMTRDAFNLFYSGEDFESPLMGSLTCPYCGDMGFDDETLLDHVTGKHHDSATVPVLCPICICRSYGIQNYTVNNFPNHLVVEHPISRPAELPANRNETNTQSVQRSSRLQAISSRRNVAIPESEAAAQQVGCARPIEPPFLELMAAHWSNSIPTEQRDDRILQHYAALGLTRQAQARRVRSEQFAENNNNNSTLAVPRAALALSDINTSRSLSTLGANILASLGRGHRVGGGDTTGTAAVTGQSQRASFISGRGQGTNGALVSSVAHNTDAGNDRIEHESKANYLLSAYNTTKLTKKQESKQKRELSDRSMFVQSLVLSSLANDFVSESSSEIVEATAEDNDTLEVSDKIKKKKHKKKEAKKKQKKSDSESTEHIKDNTLEKGYNQELSATGTKKQDCEEIDAAQAANNEQE